MARKRRFSTEPFGETIQSLMTERGVTYRGLAAKTGLSAGYLNHLVHGNRPVPSNDSWRRSQGPQVDPATSGVPDPHDHERLNGCPSCRSTLPQART